MNDQERLLAQIKRVDPDFHSKSLMEIGVYQSRLLEALVLLQLDAADKYNELKKERDDAREAARQEEERIRDMYLPPNIIFKIPGDESEPPDPHAVWPGSDIRRFVFTLDVPDDAAATEHWPAMITSAMKYYTEHTQEHPSENFATHYYDVAVSMHAHTVVLRAPGAASDSESHVDPPKCPAKPVEMALQLLRDIDGDSVAEARKLLQAAIDCVPMTLADLDRVVDKARAAGITPNGMAIAQTPIEAAVAIAGNRFGDEPREIDVRKAYESSAISDVRALLQTVGNELASGNTAKARALLTGLLEGIGES